MEKFPFNKKRLESSKGTTLVEMMVSVGILGLCITSAVLIFSSTVKVQERSLVTQELLDQMSFLVEYMGRSIRMAKKELQVPGQQCLDVGYGYNYEIPVEYRIGGDQNLGRGIRFINTLDGNDCYTIYLENGRIMQTNDRGTFPLTSQRLEVENLRFQLQGNPQPPDNFQPRVTIFLKIKPKVEGAPTVQIQTTVSQRNLDFQY